MPFINLDPEEEEAAEEMTPNLRAGFKERQRKRLSEAFPATPPPTKKSRPKASHEESDPNVPMVKVPPSDIVQPCLELVVRPPSKSTCPAEDKVSATTPGGKAKEKNAPAIPLSWEEIAALLKSTPCFTAPEPPTFELEEFFMFSHHHFVNLSGIPRMAGMVRPFHVAQDSALRCTYPLLNILLRRRRKWQALFFFYPVCLIVRF